jgi:sugar (pentulose or hexulose) kinase
MPAAHYGACYGDAFLAGVGVGLFSDSGKVTEWVRHGVSVQPDPAAHGQYERYYQIYRQLYAASAPAVHQLARLAAR